MHRSKRKVDYGILHGYRSGLEKSIQEVLEQADILFGFEKFKIPFTEPAKRRTYTPDFWFIDNGIIVESKGRFLSKDRQKHILVKQQHPDLELRFIFYHAHDFIYKGSRTTLAMWAEKYGFKWCDWGRKRTSQESPATRTLLRWANEPKNPVWIKAVERFLKV